jgi:tetrahydromethanopterin S-methyltransferase subunit G
MKIIVKHMKMNSVTGAVEGYTPVAVVDAYAFNEVNEALEYAWRYTNNVMGSWSLKIGEDANDDVEVLVKREDGMGLRSSMMGDRFEVDGVDYRVALAGFKRVEEVA